MSTEVWFRNPHDYIRELVECEIANVAWDRGMLVKRSIDADKHASLYFGRALPWRALLIGDQGTAEIGPDNPLTRPKGVYPTWMYGEDAAILQEIVERPVGEDRDMCFDLTIPVDERPVYGQEHRVIVTNIPTVSSGPGRSFMRFLKELQEDNPNCKIHVHGLYSYRVCFGMGFASADYEPRELAKKGKVVTPSGREMLYERAQSNPNWITPLGMKPADLTVPRNRCMYNIKSAVWAGEHYSELYKFPVKNTGGAVDASSSDADHKPVTTKNIFFSPTKPKAGDQFHCDTCSLQTECKYQRAGAVCSVPGAEPTELAKYFKTRDSDSIVDGLGVLMAAQTRRLERGMAEEEDFGLDPEVTKIMTALFDQGVKLAKLVNPDLRGGAKVQVNVGGGASATVTAGNPRQFIAAATRELERQGIPRDKITPKMIEGLLSGMNGQEDSRRAIDSTVVESRTEIAND